MEINVEAQIEATVVDMEGANGVTMKVLIGPKDGSQNIVMRLFIVAPGGKTPFHSHGFEHIVKIEKGRGVIVNEKKEKHEVEAGQSTFIEAGQGHQFQNPFDEPFEFLCIIPSQA
tara:strand:- start:79 stop:423 length:345 start_codon:yes stop_codon:yes gene_type:complete